MCAGAGGGGCLCSIFVWVIIVLLTDRRVDTSIAFTDYDGVGVMAGSDC